MKKISGDDADKNLDQRDGNASADRDQARDECERHPDCRDEPNVLKNDARRTKAEPNLIEHNKTPAAPCCAKQESLALKRSVRFSRNWEGKLHCRCKR